MRSFRLPLAALLLLPVSWCGAQKPEDLTEHTSETMREKFVAVPGAAVLFALHETTVLQWETFLAGSKYAWRYKPYFEQGEDHPVVGVTLQDARAFCAWLTDKERAEQKLNVAQSYRLPTQAEWDAAVALLRTRKVDLTVDERVQDERVFPWGMKWPPPLKAGNFAEGEIPGYEDGFPFTSPVGQFTPSGEGLFDLAGNVWEWCWDAQIRAEQEGVLRGGSWAYFRPECLRSDYAYRVPATLQMPTVGFRCVFEDRQRSAALLAVLEKNRQKIRDERREQMMGGPVDKAEVEALRKKMAGEEVSALPDPAKLAPAGAGKAFKNSLGMDFVPAGDKLLAGSSEVRMQDFEAWLKASGRTWEAKPSFLLGGTHPAAGLSWQDAHDFCEWLTKRDIAFKLIPDKAAYRLPTDVEWSLLAGLKEETGADPAARSGVVKDHFPWSATGAFPPPPMSTNLDALKVPDYSDSYSYTAPVSTEAPNPMGISGLGGNVAEWCRDSWPGDDSARVVRGGSWLSSDKDKLLTSARRRAPAAAASPDIGFRVVLELPAP
jgi:formylglycine-generating enzyme required for sulfatase activity